jgi:hypothetical protein
MYSICHITRSHSSGFENKTTNTFTTIEEVIDYLQNKWYDTFCEAFNFPDEWDEDDMGAPFPTKNNFTLDAINKKFGKYNRANIFNYRSQHDDLVPIEIFIERLN